MTAAVLNLRTDVEVPHRNEIFRKMGSFWNEKFEDHEVVKALVGAMQDQFNVADITLKEAVATQTSVAQAPLYHTELWYRLFILQSSITEEHPNAPYYSAQNGFYGSGLIYGQGVPTLWSWRVPTTLVNPSCAANAIENPSWVGYNNQAFFYSKGVLGFRFNPFLDPRFTVLETEQGPGIEIWFYCSEWDNRTIGKQYGGPLGIPALASTESYRKLCEGAWEARVKGPSDSALYKVIAGASGVPLCESEGEVVEVLTTAPNGEQVVVTDQRVYRFPVTHNITVTVGQVLKEGQELTDALKIRHAASVRSGEEDITLPPGFLNQSHRIKGSIRFPNRRVTVFPGGLDAFGNREISFELHGLGTDLKKYRKGANAAQIYKIFDTRGPQALTVPTAAQIKPNVNPAVDLIAAHTKPHLVLLYGDPAVWPATLEQQALLFSQSDKILPAHARLVFQPPASSESASSQSYTSSSSSSKSRSESTWSTASSQSTASTSSTRSSRSSLSTASTATSASTSSSRSLSSYGTDTSSSRSTSSLSSQSYSSRSSQSLSSSSSRSLSSKSTASTASTISTSSSISTLSTISSQSSSSLSSYTVSLLTTSSSSSSTFARRSTSSVSSRSTLAPFSTSSQSSSSSSSTSSTASTSSSRSLSSVSSVTPSSVSLSSRTTATASTLSSRSESSQSISRVTSSSRSFRTESSRSSRTDSSQTMSTASTPSSRSSQSLSSWSDVTVVIASLSSPSSNSSSSTAAYPTNCNKPMPYNIHTGTFTSNGFYDSGTGYYWIVKRFTNYTAAPLGIRIRFSASSTYEVRWAVLTSNPCGSMGAVSTAYNYAAYYDTMYTVPAGATIWGVLRNYDSTGAYNGAVSWMSSDRSSSSSKARRSTSSNSSSSKSSKSGPPYGTQSATSMSRSSLSSRSTRSTDASVPSSSSSYALRSTSSASSKSQRSSDSSLSPV